MLTRCVYSMSAFLDYISIDLSQGTIYNYKINLVHFFKFIKKHPKKILIEDIESYVALMVSKNISASLINLRLSALTSYYSYLRKKKVFSLDFNIMEDVKKPRILFKEQYIAKSNEVFHFIKLLENKKCHFAKVLNYFY